MKLSSTLLFVLSSLISASYATDVNSTLSLKNTTSHNNTSSVDTESFLVLNAGSQDGLAYYANFSFGSTRQENNLRIDVVQPYIWVINGFNIPTCEGLDFDAYTDSTGECVNHGVYNISNSETAVQHDDSWESLHFVNFVSINGSIVNDDLVAENLVLNDKVANITFDNVDFIDANDSTVYLGGLGLAALSDDDENSQYNISFLNILKDNGLTNSSSYSWFPKSSYELSLTFGGVNQSQYVGSLVQFDLIPFYNADTESLSYIFPTLPLTDITVNNNAQDSSVFIAQGQNIPVLLDSRSFYSRLPYSTIINLAVQLNAVYSDDQDIWFVKCSIGELDASIGFTFGNVTIQVPVGRFINAFTSTDNSTVVFENGDEACYMTVVPNSELGYSVLGNNFLQSAFFTVNNDGAKIAIAQANNDLFSASLEAETQTTSTTLITSVSANSTTVITSTLPHVSTSLYVPFNSSIINSGTIPFAAANNITGSWTLSYNNEGTTTRVIPVDVSGVYSSGTIYTGGRFNSTSTTSSESLSAYGLRNAEFGTTSKMGLIGLLTMLFFGIAL